MLKRLYVDDYPCLENFDLDFGGSASSLLLGWNGSGKSTVRLALELLQRIGRGASRASDLISRSQLPSHGSSPLTRFSIEAVLSGRRLLYTVAIFFEDEPWILEERLDAGGNPVFSRERDEVWLGGLGAQDKPSFAINRHVAACRFSREGRPPAP